MIKSVGQKIETYAWLIHRLRFVDSLYLFIGTFFSLAIAGAYWAFGNLLDWTSISSCLFKNLILSFIVHRSFQSLANCFYMNYNFTCIGLAFFVRILGNDKIFLFFLQLMRHFATHTWHLFTISMRSLFVLSLLVSTLSSHTTLKRISRNSSVGILWNSILTRFIKEFHLTYECYRMLLGVVEYTI